jgi:hypothetical protein
MRMDTDDADEAATTTATTTTTTTTRDSGLSIRLTHSTARERHEISHRLEIKSKPQRPPPDVFGANSNVRPPRAGG